ncbi:MAG: flagellar FliJ family protein [Proteobacteria bacterium]|nr:flagellar FliJ family protein [Pseudomonadota bacterium]MBU1545967.1 flagellar FliJ family protein [Pseudomonadota bacterium]MBU2620270.1 flagellar FliJ family protein [Pseudomonadota bacterium]
MAYHFKLETILGLRRNLEELAQQKLARELALLAKEKLRLAALQQERQELIAEFEEKKRRKMSAPVFAFYVEGIFRKEQEVEAGFARVEAGQAAVVRAREELAAKMRDKKVMEKARERDYQKYLLAALKKEHNEADEQMVLRFGRRGNLH